jgi:hypothetical protein
MRRDTAEELKARLKKDLGLPNDEFGEAVAVAVADCVWQGFWDVGPVIEKYKDLVCQWCGKLHRDDDCERKLAEYEKQKLSGKYEPLKD